MMNKVAVVSGSNQGLGFALVESLCKNLGPASSVYTRAEFEIASLSAIYITSFLVEILEAAGHSVDVASSGQAALSNLAARDYAAIICDLRMPHLDGPGLYGALSETKPHLLDRFVFITGDLLNERTDRFLKKTGRPCIEKPFMPNQIRSLVEEIAARSAG